TASRWSAMASTCHPETNGVSGSSTCQPPSTKEASDTVGYLRSPASIIGSSSVSASLSSSPNTSSSAAAQGSPDCATRYSSSDGRELDELRTDATDLVVDSLNDARRHGFVGHVVPDLAFDHALGREQEPAQLIVRDRVPALHRDDALGHPAQSLGELDGVGDVQLCIRLRALDEILQQPAHERDLGQDVEWVRLIFVLLHQVADARGRDVLVTPAHSVHDLGVAPSVVELAATGAVVLGAQTRLVPAIFLAARIPGPAVVIGLELALVLGRNLAIVGNVVRCRHFGDRSHFAPGMCSPKNAITSGKSMRSCCISSTSSALTSSTRSQFLSMRYTQKCAAHRVCGSIASRCAHCGVAAIGRSWILIGSWWYGHRINSWCAGANLRTRSMPSSQYKPLGAAACDSGRAAIALMTSVYTQARAKCEGHLVLGTSS